jgi:hypothetical protein
MNRKEFYKELMKEYTFDSAKVRRFAKRSSYKGNRVSVKRWWHVPSTVAVAAASLVMGLFAFFYYGTMGTPVIGDGATPIPAAPTADSIAISKQSFETKTLYLSFNDSMTFREMENTLYTISDTGNIVIEAVFVLDESDTVVPVFVFDAIRDDDTVQIVGAKVSAPGRLIDEIERQTEIDHVVLVTEETVNEEALIEFVLAETQAAVAPLHEPIIEDDEIDDEPDGEVAPAAVVEAFVSLNLPNVIEAYFIGDYRFIAITAESVVLYEIAVGENAVDLEITPVSEFALRNHRTRFSTTRKSALISGCNDDGRRTVLLLTDGDTQTVEMLDISELTDSGELIFAFYDDINRSIVMRVRDCERNIIYVKNRDTLAVQTVFNSTETVAILAKTPTAVYYSATNGIVTTVYKYDTESGVSAAVEALEFEGTVSFERTSDLSAFVINTDGHSQVFTADSETLSNSVEVESGLIFYRNSKEYLTNGTNFYLLSEDSLESFGGQAFSPRRNRSELFSMFEITEKSVRILIRG